MIKMKELMQEKTENDADRNNDHDNERTWHIQHPLAVLLSSVTNFEVKF